MTYRNLFAIVGVACALYAVWSLALAAWSGTKMSIYNIAAIIGASCGFWAVLALFLFAALVVVRSFSHWQDRRLSRNLAGQLAHDL